MKISSKDNVIIIKVRDRKDVKTDFSEKRVLKSFVKFTFNINQSHNKRITFLSKGSVRDRCHWFINLR